MPCTFTVAGWALCGSGARSLHARYSCKPGYFHSALNKINQESDCLAFVLPKIKIFGGRLQIEWPGPLRPRPVGTRACVCCKRLTSGPPKREKVKNISDVWLFISVEAF